VRASTSSTKPDSLRVSVWIVTWTSSPSAEVVADCTRLRRSVELPRAEGRGVPETREHEYAAAAEAAPEAIQPQYLLGLVAADEGRWQAAPATTCAAPSSSTRGWGWPG
jgi:hypothetical protein